jgi:hypothetical protein
MSNNILFGQDNKSKNSTIDKSIVQSPSHNFLSLNSPISNIPYNLPIINLDV